MAANFHRWLGYSFLFAGRVNPLPAVLRGADYHLVAGNPMRFKKEIKIEQDKLEKRLNDNQIKLAQSYNNRLHRDYDKWLIKWMTYCSKYTMRPSGKW